MIHNIVVRDSKAYMAVKPISYTACDGCAFNKTTHCQSVKCSPVERGDKKMVIYKPHYRLGVKL